MAPNPDRSPARTHIHAAEPVLLVHFGVDGTRKCFNLETVAYNDATFRCPDEEGWQPHSCPIEGDPGTAAGNGTIAAGGAIPATVDGSDAGTSTAGGVDPGISGSSRDASHLQCGSAPPAASSGNGASPAAAKQCRLAGDASQASSTSPSSNSSAQPPLQQQWGSTRTVSLDLSGILQRLQDKGHAVCISTDAGRFVCNYTLWRCLQACSQGAALQPRQRRCFGLFVHVPKFEAIDEERQRAFAVDLLDELCGLVAGGTAAATP